MNILTIHKCVCLKKLFSFVFWQWYCMWYKYHICYKYVTESTNHKYYNGSRSCSVLFSDNRLQYHVIYHINCTLEKQCSTIHTEQFVFEENVLVQAFDPLRTASVFLISVFLFLPGFEDPLQYTSHACAMGPDLSVQINKCVLYFTKSLRDWQLHKRTTNMTRQ